VTLLTRGEISKDEFVEGLKRLLDEEHTCLTLSFSEEEDYNEYLPPTLVFLQLFEDGEISENAGNALFYHSKYVNRKAVERAFLFESDTTGNAVFLNYYYGVCREGLM